MPLRKAIKKCVRNQRNDQCAREIFEAVALTDKFFPRAISLAALTSRELDAARYFFRDSQVPDSSGELRSLQLNFSIRSLIWFEINISA